jgi:hypothetical protein
MSALLLKNLPATEATDAINRNEAAEPGRRRYTVIVQRVRSRAEIVAELDQVLDKKSPDPSIECLSDDEVMGIVNAEIDASRAEKRLKNQ